MTPELARPGARVRVMEHHRVEERRGLMGTVLARYGGEEHIAVDVRFWPTASTGCSGRGTWRRSPALRLGGASCSVGTPQVNACSYSPECVEGRFSETRRA
jgi:hypothetical protein